MDTIEEAIDEIKKGRFVIVVDDPHRENEGDLIIAAEKITPKDVAFMVKHTTGIVCVALTGERLDKLQIPLMMNNNTDAYCTNFTISVDWKQTTTGVSAVDRCATIQALIDEEEQAKDFRRPGHVFPLRYNEGGVLKRAGHTEASVDLARMAGLKEAGVIAEIVDEDGSMARMPALEKFAAQHRLCLISVADIIRYRRRNEMMVKCVASARLPTEYGEFTVRVYESPNDGAAHLSLSMGDITKSSPVLVRVHSECLTGDVFHSLRCDCGDQLSTALKKISEEKCGVVIYLRGHEGRGIGLKNKISAYQLQESGKDTVEANLALGWPADIRDYSLGAQILEDLGVRNIRLMTNNPSKSKGLSGYGFKIDEIVPLVSAIHQENRAYLIAKKRKLGHILNPDQ